MSRIDLFVKVRAIDNHLEETLNSIKDQSDAFFRVILFVPQEVTFDKINGIRNVHILQYDQTNMKEKVTAALLESEADYISLIESGDFYPLDFITQMKKILPLHDNPELILFGRIHKYAIFEKHFFSHWSPFHHDSLINMETFAQCFSFVSRELEAMAVQNLCNRLYKNVNMQEKSRSIAEEFCRDFTTCGLKSLVNNETILALKDIWIYHTCGELYPNKMLERIWLYYDDLNFLYGKWINKYSLAYDFDHICDLGIQYSLWQLDKGIEAMGKVKLSKIIIEDIMQFLRSKAFQDILLLRPDDVGGLFASIRQFIMAGVPIEAVEAMKDESYIAVLQEIGLHYDRSFFYILQMAYYWQKNKTDEAAGFINRFQDYTNEMPEILKYMYIMLMMKAHLSADISPKQFDEMIEQFVKIKEQLGNSLTIDAFETIIYLILNEVESANKLIEAVEAENGDLSFYYKLCYKLCCQFGMTEMKNEFKTQIMADLIRNSNEHNGQSM